MRWKVFYRDGSTFSHEDGGAHLAPGGGVVAIASEDQEVGVLLHQGNDFYIFDELFGGWYEMDYFGLAQYIMRPGFKVVKLGESVPTEGFKALLRRLRLDPELPPKSARYPWEVPS